MLNLSLCNLKKQGIMVKVNDFCSNNKSNCRKQLIIAQSQIQLEGARFQNTVKSNLKAVKKHGIHFLSQQ